MKTFFPFLMISLIPLACAVSASNESNAPDPNGPSDLSTTYPANVLDPVNTSAQSDGTTVTVYASLTQVGNFLKLGTTDSLTASFAGAGEVPLTLEANDSEPHYVASTAAVAQTMNVSVFLHRKSGETDSLELKVPPAFDLTSTPPASFKVGDPIEVDMSAPKLDGALMVLVLEGSCIVALGGNGSVIEASSQSTATHLVFDTTNSGAIGSCAVTAKVQEWTKGAVLPHFEAVSGDVDGGLNDFARYPLGIQERRFATSVSQN